MRPWLWAIAALTLLACALPVLERTNRAGQAAVRAHAASFHVLTGGLGMGASRAPHWDFSTFDPRLEPDCACALWPIPGGYLYSPEHGLTVFDPPEIHDGAGRPGAP